MTPQNRRGPAVDSMCALALLLMAVAIYSAIFLHVPVLTEARDFLLQYGQDARVSDILIPSGDDYRPLSWKLFAWQQQLFGFRSEALNLVQFFLLGLCALAAFVHLRQLLENRLAAFGAAVLWILSLPVAHAAFWQATQHDKLAFLFTILTLFVTLHGIRSKNPGANRSDRSDRSDRFAPGFFSSPWPVSAVAMILAALAVATKPVAFMLPAALVAQAILFTTDKNRRAYLRSCAVISLPVLFVVAYALVYRFRMTPEWLAHTTSGSIGTNVLVYIRNIANIGHDGSLWIAALLFAPVAAAWLYALWRVASRPRTVEGLSPILVYLCVIFLGSMVLLVRAEFAPSFYLLVPLFAFTGSLTAIKGRFAIAGVTCVVLGLLSMYGVSLFGQSQLNQWNRNAQGVAEGYRVMQQLVNVRDLKSLSFFFQSEPEPETYFYLFSDGTHQTVDASLPSFIFRTPLKVPLNQTFGDVPSSASPGHLDVVWSRDLELKQLRFSGETIYRNEKGPSWPLTYSPGDTLVFRKGGNAKQYQGPGWSWEEDHGTWTDGSEATLFMKLDGAADIPMEVLISGQAFVSKQHPEQSVDVFANDQLLAHWTFRNEDSLTELHAAMPAELVRSPSLKLSFRILNPISPASIGLSEDSRKLGIKVETLRIQRGK
jgi:hypothetical protein